ncbi:hypothetical protein C0989_003946 [Termitomyces sp. Mn162]|nr:hypothetical protein C0989_003946 [Termitomyces sp. Mn162]
MAGPGARGCFNCGGCGGEGHVSRDCTKEAKPKSCYRCGEEGHISRDCPNADNTLPPANAECYRCGKVGHIARNCTEASTGNNMSYGGGFGGNSQKTWAISAGTALGPKNAPATPAVRTGERSLV